MLEWQRKKLMGATKFKPQLRRLLAIGEFIREGRFPSCARMAARLECSAKTIQRDIDYMRDFLDAPIAYDERKKGLYFTDKSWFMPSIMMNEGDLFAMLVGSQAMAMFQGTPVAAELKQIFDKLAAYLPDMISVPPEYLVSKVSFHAPPARAIRPEVWKQVVRGLQHQNVVEIVYKSHRYKKPLRHAIHPYHLANLEGEWYVLARSGKWKDLTQYALGRIQEAKVTETRFDIPAGFNARDVLKKRVGRFIHGDGRKTFPVRLLFAPKLASYIGEKTWRQGQKLRGRRDGSVELELPVYDVQDVVPWVQGFGPDVKVLGPKELRAVIKERAERTCRIYSERGTRKKPGVAFRKEKHPLESYTAAR